MSVGWAAPAGLRLLIGAGVMDAASADAVKAIEAQNARVRLPGLPDEFNPNVIDPAKAAALLSALPPNAAEVLGGKALFLDGVELGVGASAPTTPASFKPPVALSVIADHGPSVSARAAFKVDCAVASSRAAAARQRAAQADSAVKALEAQRQNSGAAKLLRQAVTQAWRQNAGAVADCAPGDAAAAADRDAALRAVSAALVLGGSME